jgi:hypothetical protein
VGLRAAGSAAPHRLGATHPALLQATMEARKLPRLNQAKRVPPPGSELSLLNHRPPPWVPSEPPSRGPPPGSAGTPADSPDAPPPMPPSYGAPPPYGHQPFYGAPPPHLTPPPHFTAPPPYYGAPPFQPTAAAPTPEAAAEEEPPPPPPPPPGDEVKTDGHIEPRLCAPHAESP